MASNTNYFAMIDDDNDFEMWQGLRGPAGPAGADGKSAYEAAQEGGYTGTESQFNAALAEIDTALHLDDVDDALSDTSENPVQNKVITAELTQQKSAFDATLIYPREATLNALGFDNAALLYCKPGDNITVKTADGNPFTVQRLNIADLDGTVNTYYTIQNNSSPFSATISTASTKHETYCVYVTGGTAQEIIVTNNTSVCNAKPYIDAVKETADSTVFMLNQKSINSITDVAVTDGHFSSSGLKQGGSGSSASDFIPVSTGDVITYKLSGSAGWGLLCAYSDADQKTFVSPAIATGAGWSVYQEGTYIVPDGVHYVRFSYITGNVGYSAFSLQLNSSVFPRIKDVAESAVEPIAENAGTVFAANIPEYWNNALSTKIQSIKSNEEYNIIADVCSFVFITDMHYPYNAKQSAKLIKNIVDNTNIRYILNGGDNIHNSSTEVYTPEDCVSVLYDVRKDFKKYCLDESLFSTLGNHDLNTQGTATGLSAMQMYDAIYRKTADYTEQGGWSWYYQDDKYHKVRFVSVNIYGMNQSQLSWIGDTALNVPDGWAIVLFAHALPFEKTDIGNELNRNALNLKAVLEAYQAKTTVNISDSSTSWPINYTKDFSSYNGEIACYLAGHVHSDNVITDGGITYVTTLNDSLDRRASSGGTTNEQAFDVFTLNKGTKTLKATRIGSGSDRTITY